MRGHNRTPQFPSNNRALIIGVIGILLTLSGLIFWLNGLVTAEDPQATIIIPRESSEGEAVPDLPPGFREGQPIVVIEESSAGTDPTFVLPLLLTAFGSLTSFGALVIEWRKEKRDTQEDTLNLRLQQIELELKKLELHKLRRELSVEAHADDV